MDTRIQFRVDEEAKFKESIKCAFNKLDSGEASFIDHDTAKERMSDYKARISSKIAIARDKE